MEEAEEQKACKRIPNLYVKHLSSQLGEQQGAEHQSYWNSRLCGPAQRKISWIGTQEPVIHDADGAYGDPLKVGQRCAHSAWIAAPCGVLLCFVSS